MSESYEYKGSYSDASKRLEEILQAMQSPDCELDKLISYVEEGSKLIAFCKSKIKDTEMRINQVLGEM